MAYGPHTGFILAAYITALAVVAAMTILIVSDHRALKKSLRRFGVRGEGRE